MPRNSDRGGRDRARDSVGGVVPGFRWILLVAATAIGAGGAGFLIGYWLGG